MASMASKSELNSTGHTLRAIKRQRGKLSPDSQAIYDELVKIDKAGPREIVDGVVGLTAAQRKAYIEPYAELGRRLKKAHNPNSRAYRPPPWGTLKRVARSYPVFLAWLKNRHRYKPGELHPPATDDELSGLQALVGKTVGKDDYRLPAGLVDSYRICDGVDASLLMHPDTGLRLLRVAEIRACYLDRVRSVRDWLVPFSGDGAGNIYAVGGVEVYDINHEDDTVTAIAPSFGKFFSKAHKPVRR